MRSAKSVGRVMGLMFMIQVVLAPLTYFRWMQPVLNADWLEKASGSAIQIRLALILTFVLSACTLGVAITAAPLFRRYSERMAIAFLALAVIGFGTLAMDDLTVRTMLYLSETYAKTGTSRELLQALAAMARSSWRSAHFTNLMIAHGTVFFFNAILFRFALVPRLLTGIGMATTLISTTAVAMPLFGYGFETMALYPTALCQLVLIVWLLVKGLDERQEPTAGAA